MYKKTVVVLFGGQSSEHDISRISASTIISNLMDSNNYFVLPIGITKNGEWLLYNGPIENIKNGDWQKLGIPAIISPDATHRGILKIVGTKIKHINVDIVFPVLHGLYGEDGTIQGLLELAKIPYVGCNVISSSLSMDKGFTKIVADNLNIKQAKYHILCDYEYKNPDFKILPVSKKIGYPCFVKPANAGSSIGVSKAKNKRELIEAIENAFLHDKKVIIESAVIGQEVECAVLGSGDNIKTSTVGEILPASDFYSFDAKYNNEDSKTLIPANVSSETMQKIKDLSVEIFKGVDGRGLSRIDFFVENETNEIIFNEINTMPGFTPISMYIKLFEHSKVMLTDILTELIEIALNEK